MSLIPALGARRRYAPAVRTGTSTMVDVRDVAQNNNGGAAMSCAPVFTSGRTCQPGSLPRAIGTPTMLPHSVQEPS